MRKNKLKKTLIAISLVLVLVTCIPIFMGQKHKKKMDTQLTTTPVQESGLSGTTTAMSDYSFTIDSNNFYCDVDMTWADWIESEYNNMSFITDEENYVVDASNGKLKRGDSYVLDRYYVIPDSNYTLEAPAVHFIYSTTLTENDTISGLTLDGERATNLNIPNTVTTLSAGAFDNVSDNLISLTIPNSVTNIDTTALRHVQYSDIIWSNWDLQDKGNILLNKKVSAGFYPQTYVGDSLNTALISAYSNGDLAPTGGTYKTYNVASGANASDFTEVTLYEYLYNGFKYVRLPQTDVHFYGTVYFSDQNEKSSAEATPAPTDIDLYYKVEPIVMTVLTNSNAQIQLLADKILGTHCYHHDTTVSRWQDNPDISVFLNGIDNAGGLGSFYTDSGLSEIEWEDIICNYDAITRTDSTNGDYSVSNNSHGFGGYENDSSGTVTYDHIWMPSFNEIINLFPNMNSKRCELTDLAISTYVVSSRGLGDGVFSDSSLYYNWSDYFLRSSALNSGYVYLVTYSGGLDGNYTVPNSSFGFRIMIGVNL